MTPLNKDVSVPCREIPKSLWFDNDDILFIEKINELYHHLSAVKNMLKERKSLVSYRRAIFQIIRANKRSDFYVHQSQNRIPNTLDNNKVSIKQPFEFPFSRIIEP
jgi:hypothetical protein